MVFVSRHKLVRQNNLQEKFFYTHIFLPSDSFKMFIPSLDCSGKPQTPDCNAAFLLHFIMLAAGNQQNSPACTRFMHPRLTMPRALCMGCMPVYIKAFCHIRSNTSSNLLHSAHITAGAYRQNFINFSVAQEYFRNVPEGGKLTHNAHSIFTLA